MADYGAARNSNVLRLDVAASNQSWVQPFPNFPANANIDSVSIWSATGGSGSNYDVRIGIYVGGASDSSPTGATLLEDLGQKDTASLAPAHGSATWWTINSVTRPSVTAGQRLWLVVKGTFALDVAEVNGANTGELSSSLTTWYDVAGNQGFDETVAFTSPFGSNALSGQNTNCTWKMYISYTAASAGQPTVKRWGGVPFAAGARRGVWRERLSGLLLPAWPTPSAA